MEIPSEVIEYVRSEMENRENADNMRICRMDDQKGLDKYEDIRRHGCCGFVDYQIFRWKGIAYQYGYNYGH